MDPGGGAPRATPFEPRGDEAWFEMSGAEPYAFGVALEQAAPACNGNLANGLYAGPQGDARPPIAGTPTADQTAATAAAVQPGVGAPHATPVELRGDETWVEMSDAETYAFGVALEQAAPACNGNLANGLYAGS